MLAMPQTPRSRRLSVAIAIAAGIIGVLLRLYYVTHAQVFQPLDLPNARADAVDYYRYAWNLAHHGVFASDLPGAATLHPDSFRDPGYPLFLAIGLHATASYDYWYAGILIAQALLGGIAITLAGLAFAGRMPNPWLAGALLLAAVWPHSIAMCSYVLSENVVAFLVVLGILALRWAPRSKSAWRLIIPGIVFGAAGLTNSVLLPVAPCIAVFLVWRRCVPWRAAVLLLAASLALPTLWWVRNATLESGATSSQRAVINLVQGSWPTYHAAYQLAMKGDPVGKQTSDAIDAEIATFRQGMAPGLSNLAIRMAHMPMRMAAWYASKPALLWGWDIRIGQGDIYVYPTRNSPFKNLPAWRVIESLCVALNPLLMLLTLGGVVLVLARSPDIEQVGTGITLLIVTLVYAVLQSEPRYSVPFRTLEMLLAASAAAAVVNWASERRRASQHNQRADLPS